MVFDQIYRVLSFLVSAAFLAVVGFAIYDMTKRLEYRSINLFEILLAGSFFLSAVIISWFSILTLKYRKQKECSADLLDLSGTRFTIVKRKNPFLFYVLGILNLLIAGIIVMFFSYGFALNFLNGRQFNHFSILPLIILSSFIIFGFLQFIYLIRMIRFHRSLN